MENTPKLLINDTIQFIRKFAPNVSLGTDEQLQQNVEWFLNNNFTLAVKDRDSIIGLFMGYPMSDLNILAKGLKPTVDSKGKYFYVYLVVIHPDYRGLKILSNVKAYVAEHFPTVEYAYFENEAKNEESSLIPIRRIENAPVN